MISIPVTTLADNSLAPSQPIPANAIAVVCDGTAYHVYEAGDSLSGIPVPASGDPSA